MCAGATHRGDVLQLSANDGEREGQQPVKTVQVENLSKKRKEPRFAAALTVVFALLELVNILHHAMWRDELYVWALCRHCHSVGDLLYLKRYDGHPDACYLLV
jgi:hypothetical protein